MDPLTIAAIIGGLVGLAQLINTCFDIREKWEKWKRARERPPQT